MANTYKLTINDIPKENLNLELTYNQKDESTQTLSINNTNYKCTLNKFSYKKAIYQPGEIHIELQVGKESNAAISFSEVKDIHNAFIGKFFQLQYTGKKSLNIAERYYTFDVKIEKQGSGKPLTVQIQAFDPLKFLALDKYCMAYTCKKLVTDIITKIDIWPNNLPQKLKEAITNDRQSITDKENDLNNKKKATDTSKDEIIKAIEELNTAIRNWWDKKDGFFVKSPQFITYATETDGNSDNSTGPKKNYEFIQPYLVQYNESFLDFLVRVTNRCGEFFYYEGGKIHIGWEATDPITIQEYVSVKFPQEIRTAWADYAIADIHNDYTQGKNIINFAAPIVMRDSELAFDENLAKIPPKDEYTSWQDFALFPGCFFVTHVSGALNSATLLEMLEYLTFNSAASMSNSLVLSFDTNNSYEESNFDSGKPYFNERKNGDDLHPFSTNDTNKSVNSMTAYCLDFYTNIRNGIESAERSRLQIELGDHYCEASLGSLIQFEGDTQQYIVVKIESQIDSQIDKLGLSGGETLSMEVIPYTKGQTVYPPSAHVESTRSAKAQRAIITHNQDPLKMNRVRVRYPWQGKTESVDDLKTSEDSTPWIRIALPMASDGSGFNFLPEVGDEAIINFENGNIEKPYVEGMLYSGGQTVPFSHKRNNARVLSSVNGHCIIFSDPGSSTNAIKSLSPLWSTISSFIPTAKFPFKDDDVRKAMGGIELTDEYGLYSISMSTEKRAISVDSPFGNVSINAFTGITISAPNGNIRIEGKNITLAAGNNVTIESGINKVTNFWPFSKESGISQLKDLRDTAIAKVQLIDMKIIRCIIETFLRPVGGTLLIKSNRYLRMEAGKGETKVLNKDLANNFSNFKSIKSAFKEEWPFKPANKVVYSIHIFDLLSETIRFIQKIFDANKTAFITLKQIQECFNRKYNSIFRVASRLGYKYDDWDAYFTNIKNNKKINILPSEAEKNYLAATIYNSFAKGTQELIFHLLENTIWKDNSTNLSSIIKDLVDNKDIKSQIQKCYDPVCYEKHFQELNPPEVDQNTAIDREIFRETAFKILKKLEKAQRYNLYRGIKLNAEPNSYKNADWNTFIDQQIVAVDEAQDSHPWKWLNAYNKITGTAGLFDQFVWDKSEDGKILFSDNEGTTLQFEDNTIQHYDASRDIDLKINAIQDLLRNI